MKEKLQELETELTKVLGVTETENFINKILNAARTNPTKLRANVQLATKFL